MSLVSGLSSVLCRKALIKEGQKKNQDGTPAVMRFKRLRYWIQLSSINLMPLWAEHAVTKKRRVQRNGFSPIVMSLVSGIRRTSVLSSGTYLTEGNILVNTSAC